MTIIQSLLATNHTDGPIIINNVQLANQSSNASRTLSITTHQIGDMIFVMTGNRTATAPALLSGYTNVVAINNAGSRSVRLQYKIATNSTESITWTGAYGYMIAIRNASAVLQNFVTNSSASVTSVTLPEVTNLNTASKSLLLFGTYLVGFITGVSSPLTLYSGSLGTICGRLEKNNNNILTDLNITISASIANVGYLVEII